MKLTKAVLKSMHGPITQARNLVSAKPNSLSNPQKDGSSPEKDSSTTEIGSRGSEIQSSTLEKDGSSIEIRSYSLEKDSLSSEIRSCKPEKDSSSPEIGSRSPDKVSSGHLSDPSGGLRHPLTLLQHLPSPFGGRFTQTIRTLLALALLALAPVLAMAAGDPRTALINQAMSADYDEAGALKLQAKAAGFDRATQTLVKGITLHNLSWCGQEKFTQEAIDTLASVKDQPIGQIYWGSAITLIAQYAIKRKDVGIAAAKAQEGLAVIAAAFKLEPDSFQMNYLRLLNGIEISRQSPFKQYDTIKPNVDFVVAALAKPNELDKSLKAAVWLSVGDWWFDTKQVSKALAYYQKAIREAPASRAGKKASQYLADLEG